MRGLSFFGRSFVVSSGPNGRPRRTEGSRHRVVRGPAWEGEKFVCLCGCLNRRVRSGSVAGHTQAVFSLTKEGRFVDRGSSRHFWCVPSDINQH